MAIKIIRPDHASKKNIPYVECEILADAESDITGLKDIVDDGRIAVKPAPGSCAYTADMSAVYQFSPSGVWTKL